MRGFKHEPVPRAVIEAIIESAKRAPSSMNTGLGSVINGQGVMRSDIVREVAKIPGGRGQSDLRCDGLSRR